MKFFNWVQNKLNGGHDNKKPNAIPAASTSNQAKLEEPPKERFNNWSNGLLTIGTFGNRDQSEDQEIQRVQNTASDDEIQENSSISPDDFALAEFTAEEVGHLQKELTRLLKRKPASSIVSNAHRQKGSEEDAADLPLDRFLNCPSSLEVDRTVSNRFSSNSSEYRDEEDIDRTIRAIIGRCKEVCMESKKKKSIGKKSVSFLLKKMFVCTTGFVPTTPSLRDTLQESRMEKLLRTMLSKKKYPQNASRASSTKRLLVDTHTRRTHKAENEDEDKKGEGCKWVKTDSEYIVLDLDLSSS